MKHMLIPALLLGWALAAPAQILQVTGIERVDTPEAFRAEGAVISPDGTFVVASSLSDTGLSLVNLSDGQSKQITDDGELFELTITPDSRTVVFRRSKVDTHHRRYVSVEAADLHTGATRRLAEPQRRLDAVAVHAGVVTTIDGSRRRSARVADGVEASQQAPVASIHYGSLVLNEADGTVRTLNPQGTSGCSYIWPSVSPDGTRVLYYLVGSGCYTCRLDGSDVRSLGDIRAPRWLDDNTVVGMDDEDNGYVFTRSTIVAADLSGRHQVLTDGSTIAMYPTASADGRRISFTTPEGHIYLINVKR